MLKVRDLRIDPASLGAKKLLVDVVPAYEYRNNQRTDTVTGYRYVVALPAHSLEKIGVRIDGKQLMEKPEGFIEVEFSDLEVSAYEAQGHVSSPRRPPVFCRQENDGATGRPRRSLPGNRQFPAREMSPRRQRQRRPASPR